MTEQTQIAEFNQTETALAVLREKYTEIPDCTNKEGYEECRQGIAELRTLRTGLDKARKKLNEDDQARIRFRNGEAKRITGELISLEDPMKAAKKEIDEKAEREAEALREAEEKRIGAIQARIEGIGEGMSCHAGMSLEVLENALIDCNIDSTFDFQEFHTPATLESERVSTHIRKMIAERTAYETEQRELEAKKAEMAEEQAKLDAQKKAQEEELAKWGVELEAAQRKVEEERQEAARAMKEAQEAAEAEKRRQEREKAAKEHKEMADRVAKEAEARRIEADKAKAARQEALRPDKDKLKDWFAKVRIIFINAPAGLKATEAKTLANEFMADLDNVATDYIDRLEDL